MLENVQTPIEILKLYSGNATFMLMFIIALVYLWCFEKDKVKKAVLVFASVTALVLFVFPPFAYVFMEKAVAPLGVVNTVGAGDALLSAFVHFWKNGYSDSQALKAAVTFAGLKISASGGSNGFVDEETLKKYL